MTRNNFESGLKEIYNDVIGLAAMVENAIIHTFEAIENGDEERLKFVKNNDEIVNIKEQELEEKCTDIILTQQPIAKDLRLIISILKMITDFERIGDNAADICELVLEIGTKLDVSRYLSELTRLTIKALKTSVDAYAMNNVEMAQQLKDMEFQIDQYFSEVLDEIEALMKEKPELIPYCTRVLFIAKYLERIGDRATNIAECTIYNVTGEVVKLN